MPCSSAVTRRLEGWAKLTATALAFRFTIYDSRLVFYPHAHSDPWWTKFVGAHVVRQLAARGHEITIFHRGVTETELPEGVRHIHGDFASFSDYLDELKRLSPEVVLDMVPFREEDLIV